MIDANYNEEHLANRGLLPESEYDIFCMNYPGDEKFPNYLKVSCRERLKNKGCYMSDCKYFTGPVPANPRQGYPLPKEKREPASDPLRLCVCCLKVEKIVAREICGKCHGKCTRDGTLDNYPRKRNPGSTRKLNP